MKIGPVELSALARLAPMAGVTNAPFRLIARECGSALTTSEEMDAAALLTGHPYADDIAVVSKHDTSTELNDPNEADLHQRIQDALGRTPGNPLLVVSQKTVTGHAKGGAAAWQVAGVLQTMATGWVPARSAALKLRPCCRRRP